MIKTSLITNMQESRFTAFRRFFPLIGQVTVISFIIGLVALAPTIYNMTIFDRVIAASSTETLMMLFVGAALALTVELVLRYVRNRKLAFFGARLDHYFSQVLFERMLYLSPTYTERASLYAQMARMRDFETLRDFFTGPLAGLFAELPLTALYIGAMFMIAGPLGFVSVGLACAYIILLTVMRGPLERGLRRAAEMTTKKNEFTLEMIEKMRDIRMTGLDQVWQERYRAITHDTAKASNKASFHAQIIEVMSYILMTVGGVATLAYGVTRVIDQNMTTGALVAAMILVWRIVSPMQLCCASVTRLRQLSMSTTQIHKFLSLKPEQEPTLITETPQLRGQITFSRVSLRYSMDTDPALMGVSFDIKPGQITAIRGLNGSGKSSILKLIMGLYIAQGGHVRIDGVDIRQFDPLALRRAISYVPQNPEIFTGTIVENLRMVHPEATKEECLAALDMVCAREEIMRLPNGWNTKVNGNDSEILSHDLKQRLSLARAWLKPSQVLLFDEASHNLGLENDKIFEKFVHECRNKRTVVFITHRHDHLQLADQVLTMNAGELVPVAFTLPTLTPSKEKAA